MGKGDLLWAPLIIPGVGFQDVIISSQTGLDRVRGKQGSCISHIKEPSPWPRREEGDESTRVTP